MQRYTNHALHLTITTGNEDLIRNLQTNSFITTRLLINLRSIVPKLMITYLND